MTAAVSEESLAQQPVIEQVTKEIENVSLRTAKTPFGTIAFLILFSKCTTYLPAFYHGVISARCVR